MTKRRREAGGVAGNVAAGGRVGTSERTGQSENAARRARVT